MEAVFRTKEHATNTCHLKMGQNATLLNIESPSENQNLCEWLSQIGANGTFWIDHRLPDLSSGKKFTQWKHCEPGK